MIYDLYKTQLPTAEQLNDPDFSIERWMRRELERKLAAAELLEGILEMTPDESPE